MLDDGCLINFHSEGVQERKRGREGRGVRMYVSTTIGAAAGHGGVKGNSC